MQPDSIRNLAPMPDLEMLIWLNFACQFAKWLMCLIWAFGSMPYLRRASGGCALPALVKRGRIPQLIIRHQFKTSNGFESLDDSYWYSALLIWTLILEAI
jgi:hypothetical protein